VDHIKNHHFFYGVDWDTIRDIDAPFVPHLQSITDTSYFPTDELDQVPESATELDSNASTKNLAFLGFVNFQNDVVEFVDTIFLDCSYTFKRFNN
jgi:protein-serine/threonine kinase